MLASLKKNIRSLTRDREHGAGFLSCRALEILAKAGAESTAGTVDKFLAEINGVADALIEARPDMVSIANYALFVKEELAAAAVAAKSAQRLKKTTFSMAGRLLKSQEKSSAAASRNAVKLVARHSIIMTCSYSSAVCTTLEMARRGGTDFKVLSIESHHQEISYGEIAALRLQAAGISCSVVPDEQIGWHVARADFILGGADTVSLHGWLINGAPTLALAEAAARKKRPFHVICETAKFDARGLLHGLHQPPSGFDLVPLNLMTDIVTEHGAAKIADVLKFTTKDLYGGWHGRTG